MKDQDGQYKPQDKNINLDDLVCPNCGNDVPKDQYNAVTGLVKCQDCGHVFLFMGDNNEKDETLMTNDISDNEIVHRPNGVKSGSPFLFAFLLLVIALILLWFLKNRG